MTERPTFRARYQVAHLGAEGTLLLAEDDFVLLQGRAAERLAPLLDGSRTTAELVAAVADDVSAPEAYFVLQQMQAKGLIEDATNALPASEAAFWDALGLPPAQAADRLDAASIALTTFGDVSAGAFGHALRAAGLRLAEDGTHAVVLTDDYLHPQLAAYNEAAVLAGRSFLLVRPCGVAAWIGPLLQPGQTGCWACLAHRLWANAPGRQLLARCRADAVRFPSPRAALPALTAAALHLAAVEVARWVVGATPSALDGTLVTLGASGLALERHAVIRRPQCPVCGDPVPRVARPPVLQPSPLVASDGGGYRSVPPAETFARLRHHISPITGTVRGLERQYTDGVAHAYTAGHNFATAFDSMAVFRKGLRSRSGGKGQTDLLARVSGLCEALERYAGLAQGDEPCRRATFRELGEAALHPASVLLFSARQYAERVHWNAQCPSPARRIPQPFDETARLDWSPLWSLGTGARRYLPTALCYYGYSEQEARFGRADSNGHAAGNTFEEAVLQGFLELVERDSVALWWYNRALRPAVDLDALADAYVDRLRAFYDAHDRDLWVLDLTADLDIPVFVAVSARRQAERPDLLFGFGAHLDARLGVLRALTELNQFLPGLLHSPDGRPDPAAYDAEARAWWAEATLENQPYLCPAPGLPLRRVERAQAEPPDDLRDAVQRCLDRAAARGLDVFVLDQTRPDVELSVVKVVVPGLRHFWRRLAPGRLYDVPVALGWRPSAAAEDQLNPYSVFL